MIPSLDMLGDWTPPTTYVKMSCSRSNDSKLFHFKHKGRVVGMHVLLPLHRGWVVWTNVGPVGTGTRGRPTEVRRPAGLPADLPAVINSLPLKSLKLILAPMERGG